MDVIIWLKEQKEIIMSAPISFLGFIVIGFLLGILYKKGIINAKNAAIENKNELLSIFGIPELLKIKDIASPYLTKPYAQALSSMLEEKIKQMLIALRLKDKSIATDANIQFAFEMENGVWGFGGIDMAQVRKKLEGVRLLLIDTSSRTMKLTPLGKEFVDWIIAEGGQSSYFKSNILGKWGSASVAETKTFSETIS